MIMEEYDLVKHNFKHFKKLYGKKDFGRYEEDYPYTVDDYETMDRELQIQRTELRTQIVDLMRLYEKEMTHWCVPSLRINYSEDFFRRLRAMGLQGPLWQHVRGPVRPVGREQLA